MCGIFGARSNNHISSFFLKLAEQTNLYRGPDATNHYVGEGRTKDLHFGHTRLIITGDKERGSQPVVKEKILMVYNGEIFNFSNVHVNGSSDTELLANLLEDGISDQKLNSLNGFFAFAAYYPETDSLYLVRDRFGEKPLYYRYINGELYFSSTARPFKVFGAGSISSIREARGGGIIFDENNPAENICQVPPGHLVCLKNGELTIRKWYSSGLLGVYSKNDFTRIVDTFEDILVDAVRIRIKDQDSVAVSLSGGLDSTLVVDTVKRIGGVNVEAFSLSTSDPAYNELETVKHHASQIGVKLNVVVEPSHDYDQFIRCFEAIEFPSYNFSFVGYDSYYSAVQSKGIRVIIEGHGPDEYLGGYPTMLIAYIAGRIMAGDIKEAVKALANCNHIFGMTRVRSLISVVLSAMRALGSGNLPSGKRINNQFFDRYSIPMVLRTFDRISMLNKIETRSPFMDYRLIELAKALPDEILFYGGKSKAILRAILESRGFSDSDFGPKIGFTASYDEILRELCHSNGFGHLLKGNVRKSAHKISFDIARVMSEKIFI